MYMSPVHGAGQVISTTYEPTSTSWLTEVQYYSGARDTTALPVIGILMFPAGSLPSPLVPRGEKMLSEWPSKVSKIQKNIENCAEKLTIFKEAGIGMQNVASSWKLFFDEEKSKITACQEDMEGPYYRGASLYRELNVSDDVTRIAYTPPSALTAIIPYSYDPVVHANFTSSQRLAAMEASRHPPALKGGSLVLLKLRFGTNVPSTHSLPFCLATLPLDFVTSSVPDGASVKFKPYFSTSDIGGVWSHQNPITLLQAPLRSVLVSGLEFTALRKLKHQSYIRKENTSNSTCLRARWSLKSDASEK